VPEQIPDQFPKLSTIPKSCVNSLHNERRDLPTVVAELFSQYVDALIVQKFGFVDFGEYR